MGNLARNAILTLGGLIAIDLVQSRIRKTQSFTTYFLLGNNLKQLVSANAPAWTMVATATISDTKQPKNTQTVIDVLTKLVKDTVKTPDIAKSFAVAKAAVQQWAAGTVTYDGYRQALIQAFPATKNPSTQSLLSVSLPS